VSKLTHMAKQPNACFLHGVAAGPIKLKRPDTVKLNKLLHQPGTIPVRRGFAGHDQNPHWEICHFAIFSRPVNE
jgi:hypothetical protein